MSARKAPTVPTLMAAVDDLEERGAIGSTEVTLADALRNVLTLIDDAECSGARTLTTASVRAAIAEAVL